VHRQRAYVGGELQPGASLVVVRLAVVTLPPRSTAPAVDGCRIYLEESTYHKRECVVYWYSIQKPLHRNRGYLEGLSLMT